MALTTISVIGCGTMIGTVFVVPWMPAGGLWLTNSRMVNAGAGMKGRKSFWIH
jgi:hypothetical protein